jgi:hypothetical protein
MSTQTIDLDLVRQIANEPEEIDADIWDDGDNIKFAIELLTDPDSWTTGEFSIEQRVGFAVSYIMETDDINEALIRVFAAVAQGARS